MAGTIRLPWRYRQNLSPHHGPDSLRILKAILAWLKRALEHDRRVLWRGILAEALTRNCAALSARPRRWGCWPMPRCVMRGKSIARCEPLIASDWVADCFLVCFPTRGSGPRNVGESGLKRTWAAVTNAGYSGVLEGL